jgi:hypothetical protein
MKTLNFKTEVRRTEAGALCKAFFHRQPAAPLLEHATQREVKQFETPQAKVPKTHSARRGSGRKTRVFASTYFLHSYCRSARGKGWMDAERAASGFKWNYFMHHGKRTPKVFLESLSEHYNHHGIVSGHHHNPASWRQRSQHNHVHDHLATENSGKTEGAGLHVKRIETGGPIIPEPWSHPSMIHPHSTGFIPVGGISSGPIPDLSQQGSPPQQNSYQFLELVSGNASQNPGAQIGTVVRGQNIPANSGFSEDQGGFSQPLSFIGSNQKSRSIGTSVSMAMGNLLRIPDYSGNINRLGLNGKNGKTADSKGYSANGFVGALGFVGGLGPGISNLAGEEKGDYGLTPGTIRCSSAHSADTRENDRTGQNVTSPQSQSRIEKSRFKPIGYISSIQNKRAFQLKVTQAGADLPQ